MTGPDDLPVDPDGDEIGRLHESARRDLHFGRLAAAAEVAEKLVAEHRDSTSAHELMGDVLVAQGKRAKARNEYKLAMEIEPANADAERKYAEAMLLMCDSDRTGEIIRSGDLSSLRGVAHKDASAAAVRSMFFPGLGQMYNGEYEKGIAAVVLGLPLLGLALWGLIEWTTVAVLPGAESLSLPQQMLAVFGCVAYATLLVWSIMDAQKVARESGERPRGTDMPET